MKIKLCLYPLIYLDPLESLSVMQNPNEAAVVVKVLEHETRISFYKYIRFYQVHTKQSSL